MRRSLRIGAGFLLALLIVTCTDKDVTGPRARGVAALNLSAFQSGPQPGMPDIPIDSVRVVLDRLPLSATAPALDTVIRFTPAPDTMTIDLNVSLERDPENFQLTVLAYGGGGGGPPPPDTTAVSSGKPATPVLTAKYVGPGAGATGVTMGPRDTTVVGGQTVALRVTVDSAGTPLANVPVGFLSGDTSKGKVTQPTFTTGAFVGKSTIRDSVWLYVETPTHLRDSTRIHIVPPPSQIVKLSGDSQSVIVNGATAAPLSVRVEDALNGGSPGVAVSWSVTQGSATFTPLSPVVSDTGGYVRVTVTPSSLGTVKVQATAAGLTGSPVTFTVNVLAGIVHQVIVAPKIDTVAKGVTAQFTATLKDSLGNVITSIKPVWTSSNGAVATVDSTGLATTLAGDSTFIIASAGGFADTARLFVRAPTKVALTPSDTVVTSIGDSVHLTGVVLTNFGDTVKTATVIRFTSTVPSVVTVNAVTGEAHLVGAGNGVVLATDTISKATGTATLRVNQKVFGIVNTPPDSVQVGVNGQAQILATATDKNGHPIPGKTFGWVSRNTGVATVNQSGIVTGVAVGAKTYAVDTLVDSISVFRDSTLVSVVSSPPPVMRWAFDTLAIGNGGNTTVNVSLNVPSGAGTVMQIVSADTTRVKPTQSRIAIGTGGASASVTLQGLAATLTPVDVIAQDSAGIYKPDTLRVIVVSTIFFAPVGQTTRTQDFYLNQNETLNGQVFLSDPAPAGGLGVTFVYAKGFSTTNPTTVIIPQGQLAAPIQFVGTGTGTDSVIPTSGAFVGKFSYLHVAKDTLIVAQPYPYNGILGLGQTSTPYVQLTYGMDHILPFTLAVSPSNLAAASPNPDTILVNNGNRFFTITATALGTGTITASASKWLSGSIPLTVTSPQLVVSGSTSMVAGNPSLGSYNTYAGDTLRNLHPVAAALTVHAISRDTTILKVVLDSVVIPFNSQGNTASNALFAQPGAGGDSTWLVITAPGYKPDSMLVHVTKPTMSATYSYPYDGRVALNTTFPQPVYVQIPYARTDTFALVLHHTNKAGPAAPDTLFIPKGNTVGYLAGITGVSVGIDSVSIDTVATKPGYVLPAGTVWVFHVDSLHVRTYSYSTSLVTINTPTQLTLVAWDAVNQYPRPLLTPLTATLALSRPNVVTLDSLSITIPAGSAYSGIDTMRVAVGVNAPDSTRVLTTAPGSTPDSSQIIHVTPTPLGIGLSYSGLIGRGLRTGYGNTVNLPAAAPNTLTVVLSHAVPGKDSVVPVTVTIPKGSTFSNVFDLIGLDSIGVDTLIASAPGFVAGRSLVQLFRDTLIISRPGFTQLTTAPPYRMVTSLYAKVGYNQRPAAPVTITVTSTNPTVVSIDSGSTVNGTLDTVTAAVDTAHYGGTVRINFVGPGTAFLKATAPGFGTDSIGPFTVTGPSLSFTNPGLTVGTGQFSLEQVTVNNPVGSPLTVTLQRSDSTLPPGSQAFALNPVTLTIPANSTISNVDTVFGNAIGTAQLIARAPGYGQATATVQVGKPQLIAPASISLLIGAQPAGVGVNTQDQNGNYRQVEAPLTVTATVTDPTVASVDSATRIVPFGGNGLPSTFKFTALKKGSVQAVFSAPGYKPDTMVVTADTGTLNLQGTPVLAVGQTYQAYLSVPFSNLNDVVVSLNSTNPSVLSVPATATIPAGQTAVNFFYTGTGIGSAQVTASAPGLHPSPAAGTIVTAPHVTVSITLTNTAGQAEFFSVYTTDSTGVAHGVVAPVVVHLSSSAGAHATFQSDSVVIPAGNSNVNDYVTFDTAGGYTVSGSATGYITGTTPPITVSGAVIKVGPAIAFTPPLDTIPAGKTVTWVWDATNTLSHGVQWLTWPGAAQPNNSSTQTQGIYAWTFSTPGTYTYQCIVHGAAMTGTIVVQ